MLIAEDIRFTYPGTARPVLEGVSLELAPGEMLAITGPNGSGKTTLALILAGLIEPQSGMVSFEGFDLFSDDGQEVARCKIGFLFQDPADGILTTSVEREIAFGPENLAMPTPELRLLVDSLLDEFDLRSERSRPVEELSGGGVERCALAAAVATRPSLLILDEPDSFLDFAGKRRFWAEIERLRDSGTAMVFITQSVAAAGRADNVLELGSNISNTLYNNAIEHNILSKTLDNTLLSLDNIDFLYGRDVALEDVSLDFHGGQSVAILGPSGAGKTTLARVCAGLYKPDSGTIDAKGRVGISFQFPGRQLFAETVLDDVAFGPKSLKINDPNTIAIKALETIGIGEEFYGRSPFELSDGEQRLVGIAGVLATGARCIIFDEPAATLDSTGKARFIELVGRLLSERRAVGIITHELELAAACANRAVVLQKGRVVYDGDIDNLMQDRELRNSFGLGTEEDLWV